MRYCRNCRRFVSSEIDVCPFCITEDLKELFIANGDDKKNNLGSPLIGIEIVLNDRLFITKEIIGMGGYGLILKVEEKNSSELFAMKLPLSFEQCFEDRSNFSIREIESSEKSIRDEISVIKKLNTERTIKVFETGVAFSGKKKEFLAILMEIAVCNMRDIVMLEASGELEISLAEKLEMTSQIIRTIADLHRSGIIHRDIALENIFVVERGKEIKYVMADFGTSRETNRKKGEKTTGIIGRDKYLDPIRFDKRYRRDPRVDIFTAGIVITEIFIGNLWDNIIYEPLYEIDFEREFLQCFAVEQIDKRIVKFISRAIKTDINKRYENADKMVKNFDSTVKKIKKISGVKKIVRSIDLIYNINVPLKKDEQGTDNHVCIENQKKISLSINDRTVIEFRGGKIGGVRLKDTPFFETRFDGEKIYIVADRKRMEKAFGFFKKERFSGDRGILYFLGKLEIEYESGIIG